MSFNLKHLLNDVVHPFGMGQPPQNNRPTPAQTPPPGFNSPPNNNMAPANHPSLGSRLHNALNTTGGFIHRDIISPVNNAVVKPVTNTVSGDIVEPARALSAQLTNNAAAEVAANTRAQASQQASLPQLLVKPFAKIGEGLAYTPEAIAREIHNQPITDIQQRVFGTSNPVDIAKEIAGNTVAAGLSVAAPGAGKLATDAVAPVVDSIKSPLMRGLLTAATRSTAEAPTGAAYNVANLEANNPAASFKDVKSAAGQGALLFGAMGAAPEAAGAIKAGTPKLVEYAKSHTDAIKNNEVGAVGSDVGATNPHPLTQAADTHFKENNAQALKDYQARVMQEFPTKVPNVVSGDEAKFVVPGAATGGKLDTKMSNYVHEPASTFAKSYYKQLLNDKTTQDKPVLITAGGAGAGKTTGLKALAAEGHPLEDYAAVNDTNLTNMKSATSRIEPALKSGRSVDIAYVYRDPVEAFTGGNLPRGARTGRIVPIKAHIDTHAGSLDTVLKVAEKYKNDPRVKIHAIDNSRGAGNATSVSLDFLKNKHYNKEELTKALQNELTKAKNANQVTPEAAQAYQEGLRPSVRQRSPKSNQKSLTPAETKNKQLVNELDSARAPQNQKLSRFANKTVPKSPEVSGTVKGLVKDEQVGYIPHSDKARLDSARQWVNGKSTNNAFSKAIQGLTSKSVKDQDVFNAFALAKKLDATGKESDSYLATELYAEASKVGSPAGQLVQAFSSLNHRTPEGLHYAAIKTLKKAGVEITDEIKANIKNQMTKIKATAEGSDARQVASQKLVQYINQKIPRTKLEAGIDFWRAGLLTGPETVAKIASSHFITSPMELIDRPLAAATDKLVSSAPNSFLKYLNRNQKNAVPGQRTVTFSPKDLGAFSKGYGTGIKAAGQHLKSGVDQPHTGGFAKDFGKGHHQTKYEESVYRVHGSVYKPFYSGAYKLEEASLRRIAQKQFGNDATAVEEFLKSPKAVKQMEDYAAQFAMQNKTAPGELTQTIQHFKPGGVPIGQWIAPFSRIPAALGVKGIVDYTPIGTLRSARQLYSGIAKGEFDQRKFVETLSKSAVGGTGLIAAGALLMGGGRMTLQEPTDPKEKALWEAQGKSRNSIKIGNKWVTLNAFGPVGIALGIGGAFSRALSGGSGGENAVAEAIGSGAKLLADQPYMKGVTGIGNVLQDPVRYASSYVRNALTSFIPAGAQQTARGTDKSQRAYPDTLKNAAKAALPGAREGLPAAHDLFGTTEPGLSKGGVTSGVSGITNPLYPSAQRNKTDAPTQELQRLYNTLDSADTPAIATPNYVTISGNKIKLNNSQQQAMLAGTGPVIHEGIQQLLNNPIYGSLNDNQKAKAIDSVISQARQAWVTANGNAQFKAASLPDKTAQGKNATLTKDQKAQLNLPSSASANKKTTKTTTTKIQYNYSVNSATLTHQKNSGDLQGYLSTASKQLQNIQQQLSDPSTPPLKALTLQNEAQTLQSNIAKYKSYGGFTKAKTSKTSTSARRASSHIKGGYKFFNPVAREKSLRSLLAAAKVSKTA